MSREKTILKPSNFETEVLSWRSQNNLTDRLKKLKQFVVEESFQQVRRDQEKRQRHKRNNSKTEQNRYYGTRRRKNNFR